MRGIQIETLLEFAKQGRNAHEIGTITGLTADHVRLRLLEVGVRLVPKPNHQPLDVRFWQQVKKGDGCWLWVGSATSDSYGVIRANGRQNRAHRISWELTRGPIPDGMCVLHHCDNPPCVNPEHLFLGTTQENSDDKVAKGRAPHGQRHPHAKLTDEQARLVIEQRAAGQPVKEIARGLNVTVGTVYFIIQGRSWRGVTKMSSQDTSAGPPCGEACQPGPIDAEKGRAA